MMERRANVISTLRSMNVGDEELFPLEQRRSVRNTIYDGLMDERAVGKRWRVLTNINEQIVTVIRTQ